MLPGNRQAPASISERGRADSQHPVSRPCCSKVVNLVVQRLGRHGRWWCRMKTAAASSPPGLLRLSSFYERVHAPTLGTTLGIGSVLLASMLFFSVLQSRPVLHDRRGLGGYDACHPLTAGARCSVPRPPGGQRPGASPAVAAPWLLCNPTDPAAPSSKRSGQRT